MAEVAVEVMLVHRRPSLEIVQEEHWLDRGPSFRVTPLYLRQVAPAAVTVCCELSQYLGNERLEHCLRILMDLMVSQYRING